MYYHFPHSACKNGILVTMAYAALLTLSPFSPAQAQAIEAEVRAILIDDSIRYEEKSERFVELGKPAVPALVYHLRNGDRTTRFIVIGALGRIRDKRATLPLMSALEGDNAHIVLQALVEISDARSEAMFMRIMTSQTEPITYRLLAAQGLIRLGAGTSQSKAANFVLDRETLERAYRGPGDQNMGPFPDELWSDVLLELGSVEALAKAAWLLTATPLPHEAFRLVRALSALDKPTEAVIDALLSTAENISGEVEVRCAAIEALIGYGDLVSKERLLQCIDAVMPDAKTLYHPFYVERLSKLRARVMNNGNEELEAPE